jgi:hypothetical protein
MLAAAGFVRIASHPGTRPYITSVVTALTPRDSAAE